MSNKLYIGTLNGDRFYLRKHWRVCGWYWGFGYLTNQYNLFHAHYDYTFLNKSVVLHPTDTLTNYLQFEKTKLTESELWQLHELMQTAYTLKKAAEIYLRGGSNFSINPLASTLKNPTLWLQTNEQIELVLNTAWELLVVANKRTRYFTKEG